VGLVSLRPAGEAPYLQRSHQADLIAGVDPGRSRRVKGHELGVKSLRPLPQRPFHQLPAGFRAARRSRTETAQERPQIKPRAPDDQRKPAPLQTVCNGGFGLGPEPGGVVLLIRLNHVNEVVPDGAEVGRRGLPCPDVHSPIDLA
jgi:hypothetical protein